MTKSIHFLHGNNFIRLYTGDSYGHQLCSFGSRLVALLSWISVCLRQKFIRPFQNIFAYFNSNFVCICYYLTKTPIFNVVNKARKLKLNLYMKSNIFCWELFVYINNRLSEIVNINYKVVFFFLFWAVLYVIKGFLEGVHRGTKIIKLDQGDI